jgi:hypothetical protein
LALLGSLPIKTTKSSCGVLPRLVEAGQRWVIVVAAFELSPVIAGLLLVKNLYQVLQALHQASPDEVRN